MMETWHIAQSVPQTFDMWVREEMDVDPSRNVDILKDFPAASYPFL